MSETAWLILYGSGTAVRQKTCGCEGQRTRTDGAIQVKEILDERYSRANKMRLAMDNLNIRDIASLH
jgi:hypothetical protein